MSVGVVIALCVAALIVGAAAAGYICFNKGIAYRQRTAEAAIGSAEKEAERLIAEAEKAVAGAKKSSEKILAEAEKNADYLKKEKLVEANDQINKQRQEAEKELKERRSEVTRQERRLNQKEESLDKKMNSLERKDEQLQNQLKKAEDKYAEAEKLWESRRSELERISQLTAEQAKEYLLASLEDELTHEKAVRLSAYESQLKDECESKARQYISLAIARCAADQVSETAVSVVTLPNDDMKGRIIGREGRNIRAIETLTGADLIIDDTPEAITISCFDQVRREIARIALEKLIADGRIHPTRIEEMVDKARREVEHKIKQEGERAVLETNVHGLNHELIKLIGRLRYRTSYRQNVLDHSIEVAHLAGMMASELGVDANLARRAGLLHDIGKALSYEIEGSHVQIGVDVCKKYKESPDVIHAIEAHHGDVETRTVVAALVQAADAISAARPGARSENYENYIKRLEKLEEICSSFEGVEKTYAIQAGREVRVMIKPEKLNDEKMVIVAREIAKKIENEMNYPGQIKINLIRESRVVEYAK